MDIYKEIFLMQQTYATLFSLANKLQVHGDKCYDKLSARQFMAMIAIAHLKEDETTLNNVAKKLGTTKQSIKQIVTILESKGYIITVPSQLDKRAVNVIITEEGKQVMLEYSEKGLYLFADLFKEFSTEEIQTLWKLLKKLYRFDGEEQDGFEAEAVLEIGEEKDIVQARALKEFQRLRNDAIKINKGAIVSKGEK